jgi:hypothetical protein
MKSDLSSRYNEVLRAKIEENVRKVVHRRWRAGILLKGYLRRCFEHSYNPEIEQSCEGCSWHGKPRLRVSSALTRCTD